MSECKYLPTFSELLDRLTINQIKEVKITDHREEYSQEISDLLHDIQLILEKEKPEVTAEMIRDIIILAQYNHHIWVNEAEARKGNEAGSNLFLSHSLNSIRNAAKNRIQNKIGGRKDYKLDCAKAFPEWTPSGYSLK